MKFILIPAAVLVFILAGGIFFLAYNGLFANLKVQVKPAGPFMLVYQKHTGDYRGTGKIMDTIYYGLLENKNITTFKGFGMYYDVPAETKVEDRRSIAGCILEQQNIKSVNELKSNYMVKELPASEYVYCDFPYKGQGSVMLGIMRVYPAIFKFALEKGLARTPILEVYDIPNKKIRYYMGTKFSQQVYLDFLQ